MSWRTEWSSISGRIRGLLDAGSFFLQIGHDDPHGVISRELRPAAVVVFESIVKFRETYRGNLSPSALSCLDDFINRSLEFFSSQFNPMLVCRFLQVLLTSLTLFQSEFSFYLSDTQTIARRLSERAFIHLKRLIVADSFTRDRWIEAFRAGETDCEKLGAIHLLFHGIWAFKVNAEGGRTDLVLGDRPLDLSDVESTAEALVLTEWKKVSHENELKPKIEEAHAQAKLYTEGILAGIELAGYRYLVLVSDHDLVMPPEVQDGDAVYRHINIAVNPERPSVSSRKMIRSGT